MDNIKSGDILKLIFNILPKKITLKIAKYNKILQNKLNLSLNVYKEFSQIEIEIIPTTKDFGEFIKYPNELAQYYHIYFNDEKKEIKRNIITEENEVSKIIIKIDPQIEYFISLFEKCQVIETISFSKFCRRNIINMRYMFSSCPNLQMVNLFNCNTENVIDMRYMFQNCPYLQVVNFSNCNIEKVKNMNGMFEWCLSLKYVYFSNCKIKPDTNLSYMFYQCQSLIELDISGFDLENVESEKIDKMFTGCSDKIIEQIRAQYLNISDSAFENEKIRCRRF